MRQILRTHLEKYSDELVQDRLGDYSAFSAETGPRVMVAGHMDEVSFMVSWITEKVFCGFRPWGMVESGDARPAGRGGHPGGKRIPGVIGSFPPHLLKPEARQKPWRSRRCLSMSVRETGRKSNGWASAPVTRPFRFVPLSRWKGEGG